MNHQKRKTKKQIQALLCALVILSLCIIGLYVKYWDRSVKDQPSAIPEQDVQTTVSEVLPFLNIEETRPQFALPFCEKKNCIEVDVQSLQTQETWINQWIADSQSRVIQDQIGLKQVMTVQQAIDAYVRQSDAWQSQFSQYLPYELHLQTRIAAQRNQYVLLQIIVNSKQEEVSVKDRGYFFVADRKAQRKLSILDVIEPSKQQALNQYIQEKYSAWLAEQSHEVKQAAPKKLYWGQNDWFFDEEGLGIHYRASEITPNGTQLDIYLSKQQTEQILKQDIFAKMF